MPTRRLFKQQKRLAGSGFGNILYKENVTLTKGRVHCEGSVCGSDDGSWEGDRRGGFVTLCYCARQSKSDST